MMSKRKLLAFLCALCIGSSANAADSPPKANEPDPVLERLDAILDRLDLIEQRLAAVEAELFAARNFTVDDAGIMRLPSGRPIGFWGIDNPQPRPIRLR